MDNDSNYADHPGDISNQTRYTEAVPDPKEDHEVDVSATHPDGESESGRHSAETETVVETPGGTTVSEESRPSPGPSADSSEDSSTES